MNPNIAAIQLKRLFNPVDLNHTLQHLSILSWHTYLAGPTDKNLLFPAVNAPVLQYIAQSLIISEASRKKRTFLKGAGWLQALSFAGEMLNPVDLSPEILGTGSLEDLTVKLFAPLMRHQSRMSLRDPLEQIAQNWQIYHEIPVRYASELKRRAGPKYLDIPQEFQNRLGLSTEEIYIIATALLMRYAHDARYIGDVLENSPKNLKDSERAEWIIDQFNANPNIFSLDFTNQDLQNYLKHDNSEMVDKWLSAFSATHQTVKNRLESHRRYWAGEQTYQILPLDATPVIRMGEGKFIVPDSNSLVAWMGSLPELYALHHFPKEDWERLRTTLGFIQEIYLQELAQATFPDAKFISEHAYRRPDHSNQVHGPDLTILESGDRSMVMLESKAILFEDYARIGSSIEPFRSIDERFSDVVIKADWKASDLLDPRVNTYNAYRKQLADVDPSRVITVIVYAEPLYAFDVTWRARRRLIDHPLYQHKPNFIALSVEEIGHFFEASRQSGRSLYDLLSEQVNEVESRNIGFSSSVIDCLSLKLKGSIQGETVEQFLQRLRTLAGLTSQP